MKTNDQEGTIMLSKRRVDAAKGWEILESKVDSGKFLQVRLQRLLRAV